MTTKISHVLGVIASIVSIVGGLVVFLPKQEPAATPSPAPIQIQSGSGNMQAGRDIIINHKGESTRGDGVFLYEEKVEIYWNEWWAHPLQSHETMKKYGQAELTITGEGKTVDFSGVISMNCNNGKYYWKTATNFQTALSGEKDLMAVVPDQVHKNVYKLFCRER